MCTCSCTACSIVNKVYTVCVCVCVSVLLHEQHVCYNEVLYMYIMWLCTYCINKVYMCLFICTYLYMHHMKRYYYYLLHVKQFIITYQIRITCKTCFLRGYLILKDNIYNTTVCIHKEIYLCMYLHAGTCGYMYSSVTSINGHFLIVSISIITVHHTCTFQYCKLIMGTSACLQSVFFVSL